MDEQNLYYLGAPVIGIGANKLVRKLFSKKHDAVSSFTPEQLDRIKQLKSKLGIDVEVAADAINRIQYNDKGPFKIFYDGKNEEALLHEFGHYKDYSKFKKPGLRAFLRGGIAPKVGLALGGLMSVDDDTRPYAAAPAFLGYTPRLYDEYKASKYAIQAAEDAAKARKYLSRGFNSYLAPALAAPIAIYGFNTLLEKLQK